MSVAAKSLIERRQARTQKDRRTHHRVRLALRGRFMHGDQDYPLLVHNISCGGAFIRAQTTPEIDAKVVCYLDGLGRVPARIVRPSENGFAVAFEATAHKRAKLADQLTWLVNQEKYDLNIEETRDAPRKAANGPALVKRANGMKLQCRVVDISLTGAAFESRASAPALGERVQVGKLRGEVVRSIGKEFAIRFEHAPK